MASSQDSCKSQRDGLGNLLRSLLFQYHTLMSTGHLGCDLLKGEACLCTRPTSCLSSLHLESGGSRVICKFRAKFEVI